MLDYKVMGGEVITSKGTNDFQCFKNPLFEPRLAFDP